MTTSDAAANEPTAAAPEPVAAAETTEVETHESAPADAEVAAPSGAPEPANDAPKKRGRKRKASVTEEKKPASDEAAAATEATEAEGETKPVVEKKQPKEKKPAAKKAKAATTASPAKKKVGRPRKIVKEESESEDETENELKRRVDALPEEIKAKFGTIVWAKMVGFPYWPALITDPRLLPSKFHVNALKECEAKYFVCFYQTMDFSPVLFKNIEAWDDAKHEYRSGHPAKDAKAPKRRSQLMAAIELADKDSPLPADERMDGLMKVVEEEVDPSQDEEEEVEVAPKRKPGRPVGSKNKPKTTDASATVSSPAPKAKRGRKKASEADGEEATETPAHETPEDEEESTTPALSKDEIKAKVAGRKAPSKKKTASAEEKSAAAAAKKALKANAKTEPSAKGEVDSKRKKEIELVVPRKSVKSADIREATEEAARKKSGPREKQKDKGAYKVGNLTQFAGKMNRLHANESSKNNDELIQMLTKLFEEKMVYRSDAERSGVAAVIAVLRKSSNPTVAQTASAVRKHLMKVLNDDVEGAKKHKAEAEAESKPEKKQKIAEKAPEPIAPAETNGKENGDATPEDQVEAEKSGPTDENKPEPTDENKLAAQPEATPSDEKVAADPSPEDAEKEQTKPASPVKMDMVQVSTGPKADPTGDKGRMMCIEMLKKALSSIGEKSAQIAREIEEQVFDRFKEANEEYRACARSITFGLKKNEKVRERLNNGDLHALELAYTHEVILG